MSDICKLLEHIKANLPDSFPANLLNIINTKNEKESSNILNEIVPKECRDDFNFLIVAFGQTICTIKNQKCDKCNIKKFIK